MPKGLANMSWQTKKNIRLTIILGYKQLPLTRVLVVTCRGFCMNSGTWKWEGGYRYCYCYCYYLFPLPVASDRPSPVRHIQFACLLICWQTGVHRIMLMWLLHLCHKTCFQFKAKCWILCCAETKRGWFVINNFVMYSLLPLYITLAYVALCIACYAHYMISMLERQVPNQQMPQIIVYTMVLW